MNNSLFNSFELGFYAGKKEQQHPAAERGGSCQRRTAVKPEGSRGRGYVEKGRGEAGAGAGVVSDGKAEY